MKKHLLIFFTFSFSFFTCLQVQAQSWLWARQGKNHTTYNDAEGIAMDSYHNAYLTGYYSNDTLVFGSDTLFAPNGILGETYLVKYNENGNLLWAKSSQTSKNGWASTTSVAVDKQNNVYITGHFYDTAYFQSFAVYDQYYPLVFLTKYDTNGNVKWVRQCTRASGSGNVNTGQGIAVDKSGDIYVAGYFGDTISFGPYILYNKSSSSFFIVKYDSSGNVLWARQSVNGTGMNDASAALGGNCITIDKAGYIYASGYFTDTTHFGSYMLTSKFQEAFVVKYDSNGNVIWARQSNSASSQSSAAGYGICTDKKGNVYTTGVINDTVNFGSTTLISPYIHYAIYWAKYSSSGNVLWAKQSYNLDTNFWWSWDITTDNYENLYLTGIHAVNSYINVRVVFDSDTLQLNKADQSLIFIKMDSSGKVTNGYIFNCIAIKEPLAVDSSGCYVYYGGCTDTTTVFGNDTVGADLPQYVENRPFIARWSPGECATSINDIKSPEPGISIYPNPTNKLLNINFNGQLYGPATLSIMDITGRMVLHSSCIIHHSPLIMDVSSLTTGMYFITVNINGNQFNKKFIKINTL